MHVFTVTNSIIIISHLGGTIFYQPSNPVMYYGESITLSLHTSNSATSIVSSHPYVELNDTFIYIYNSTQYENILINVSVETNGNIIRTEVVVFVVPCSVKQTDYCTPEDVKKIYFI